MNDFQKFRKSHNLTIKQVSDIYEIPYRTLQNWEYGVTNPPKYLLKLMDNAWYGEKYCNMLSILEQRKKELKKC